MDGADLYAGALEKAYQGHLGYDGINVSMVLRSTRLLF